MAEAVRFDWVTITEEDIREGVKDDCKNCALARAINRRLPHRSVADVAIGFVLFDVYTPDGWVYRRTKLPGVAIEFVEYFDGGDPVYPLSIALELPEGVSFTC